MAEIRRITLSLPSDLVVALRAASGGNLSRLVSSVMRQDLERRRRRDLRRALAAGYASEADLDLAICGEFRNVDREAAWTGESGW